MFEVQDWGLLDYGLAVQKQKELVAEVQKKRDRNILVFCQHPAVITIGRNGTGNNVLADKNFLRQMGIAVYEVDRGGDVTLHNPGQLVGYPIFNLNNYKLDLHWLLREIEECIIESLSDFSIESGRVPGLTGVWVENTRKICAIGFHVSRWVTSHGFALNVNNDLSEFGLIVPCGISDKEVTSIEKETGKENDFSVVQDKVKKAFEKHF